MDLVRIAQHSALKGYVPYILGFFSCYFAMQRLFAVPKELQHLPAVPVLPTLTSFACCEAEDARIKRLLLPYAQNGEPAVLMYALGRWIIHVLDSKIAKRMSANPDTYPKEVPSDGFLLWKFIGYNNVILSNGATWKRHSRIVKAALDRNLPVEEFGLLAHKLFKQMGNGGRLHWGDLTTRYTLDVVGTAALGYDFNAIEDPDNSLSKHFGYIMDSIANPAYIALPKLEMIFPRNHIVAAIDELVKSFQKLIAEKKDNPGNDILTYMLEDKEMSDTEYRDNMVVLFMAGHDTSTGAISSLCYFLATHPNIQARARAEVRAAMANNSSGIPTIAELREMPFLQACIRETLRVNTPITYVIPRTVTKDVSLSGSSGKDLFIPRGSTIFINITTIHHRDDYWPNPSMFDPDRFMGSSETQKEYDATQWLPFLLGPRQCPARNFAMYEQRTFSAMLLNEWEWTLPKDSPHRNGLKNKFSPFALSVPQDLYLEFKRCNDA